MKDIKQYFSPNQDQETVRDPVESEANGDTHEESTERKRRRPKGSTGKKRPRLLVISDDDSPSCEVPSSGEGELKPTVKKRRMKSKPRKSSDEELPEEPPEDPDVLKPKNSLFKYFNVVDKCEIKTQESKRTTIEVVAEVHSSPDENGTEGRTRPRTERKRKGKRKKRVAAEPEILVLGEEEAPAEPVEPTEPVEASPETETTRTLRPRKTPSYEDSLVKSESDDVDSSVQDDDDVQEVPQLTLRIRRTMGTLTSYFGLPSKKSPVPKPMMSQEELKNRHEFLLSAAPVELLKMVRGGTSSVSEGLVAPFPVVSHVRQVNPMSLMWNLQSIPVSLNEIDDSTPTPLSSVTSSQSILNESTKDNSTFERFSKASKKQIKQFKNGDGKSMGKLMDKWKGLNGHELLWTDKYRPSTISEIVGNRKQLQTLTNWLQNFKALSKDDVDSLHSDSDSDLLTNTTSKDSFSSRTQERIALLTGRPGTGLTSSVFIHEADQGYQVLEVNASCVRHGKWLLQQFSEATQSQRIDAKGQTSLFGLNGGAGGGKASSKDETSKSLILFEDAELIFADKDEGYLSSLVTLASSSKRPLILTSNESHPKPLLKALGSLPLLKLALERPSQQELGLWLQAVALSNGLLLDERTSLELVQGAEGDVRRALLQLQVAEGPAHLRMLQHGLKPCWVSLEGLFWSDPPQKLTTATGLLCTLDILSTSADLYQKNDFLTPFWVSEVKDSTNLQERAEPFKPLLSLISDLKGLFLAYVTKKQSQDLPRTRSVSRTGHTQALASTVPASQSLSHYSLLDYSAALRGIAKSELTRLSTSTKRNARFLNYLSNVGCDPTERVMKELSSTFVADS